MLTLALVMTVLMGGILAYNGDLIGRRFGKKRVTMFGLRPRYTAVLITSVTGIMISGITTAVLFLLVPSVRDVILRGEQALAQLPTLKSELKEKQSEKDRVEAKVLALGGEVADQRAKLARLDVDVKKKQAQLDLAQSGLARVQSQLAASQTRLAETNARNLLLAGKNHTLAAKNSTLVDINQSLAQSNGKLSQQNDDLAKLNEALAKDNTKKAKLNTDLEQTNSEYAQTNENLIRQRTALEKEISVKTKVVQDAEKTALSLKQDNDALTARNARLTAENTELQDVVTKIAPGYNSIRDAYWAARSKRVAVHRDEDLARVVIPADTDPDHVREYLKTLMRDASEAAKAHGAGSSDGGTRAVQVVDRQFVEQLPDGEIKTTQVTGEDRVNAVVSKLAWQTVPCAVLAIAVTNSVEQEPAAIDLQPLPNRLVFQKGQLVFWRHLNANQTDPGIYVDVVKFLKEMGRTALEQGVIPRMDPMTGEPEVGAMSGSDIVDLMAKIRSVGGRARVRAVAQQDIYSADPLKLKFEVTQ